MAASQDLRRLRSLLPYLRPDRRRVALALYLGNQLENLGIGALSERLHDDVPSLNR